MQSYGGSCLCGAVVFSVGPKIGPTVHCHCTQCQRAHGAAFVTWVCQKDKNFSLDAGEDVLRWYQSSPQAQRGFCGHCGSSMFFRSQRWPGETHVVVACLKEQERFKPQAHVFYATHVSWVECKDDLPRRG